MRARVTNKGSQAPGPADFSLCKRRGSGRSAELSVRPRALVYRGSHGDRPRNSGQTPWTPEDRQARGVAHGLHRRVGPDGSGIGANPGTFILLTSKLELDA